MADQNWSRITVREFVDLLSQRKGERKERTELRRQHDLERIKEMNSTTGVGPLDIFPKELWEVILDELDSPADKGNISKVHELFNVMMDNHRIRDILFPQAFEATMYMGSPLREQYKSLRGVSKSLRDTIDKCYEAFLSKSILDPWETMFSTIELSEQSLSRVPNIITKYFTGAEKARPKRFYSRCLTIKFPNQPSRFFCYKKDVTTFLEQVGNQVFHLYYCNHDDNMSLVAREGRMKISQMYREFLRYLAFMPNLKWLHLDLRKLDIIDPETEVDRILLEKLLVEQPPPTLKHLERIELYTNEENIFPIYEAVLRANPQVKVLFFRSKTTKFLSRSVIHSLSLEVFIPDNFSSLDCIQPLVNRDWKLKRIQLSSSLSSINSLFWFLETFPTLENASLRLRSSDLKFPETVSHLRLPNLTQLAMSIAHHEEDDTEPEKLGSSAGAHFFFSLQFLIYATKLKSIDWEDDLKNPKPLRESLEKESHLGRSIDFCGGWRDLSDSNIWDVFPDLEDVKVTCNHDVKGNGKTDKTITKTYRRQTLIHSEISSSD